MRHGSSCGCPDCTKFHPDRFRSELTMKPMKRAVEIAAAMKIELRDGYTVQAARRDFAVTISEAVRPLRDELIWVRKILGSTDYERDVALQDLVAQIDAALKEWENIE